MLREIHLFTVSSEAAPVAVNKWICRNNLIFIPSVMAEGAEKFMIYSLQLVLASHLLISLLTGRYIKCAGGRTGGYLPEQRNILGIYYWAMTYFRKSLMHHKSLLGKFNLCAV